MAPQRISDDVQAPFGYDEDGTVIAPYGLKADGTPRLSNRGRTAGQGFGGGGAPKKKAAPAPPKKSRPGPAEQPTVKRNGQVDYVAAATGAVSMAAMIPGLLGGTKLAERFIGPKHSLALRGDSAILGMMAEPLGAALGTIAPGVPWLAGLLKGGSIPKEWAVLAVTLSKLTMAVVENHRQPSQQLADLSQSMVALQAQQIAQQIKAMQDEAEQVAEPEAQPAPAGPEQAPDLETQRLEEWYRRHQAPDPRAAAAAAQFLGDNIPGQTTVYDLTEPPYREAS
ncbi:hypothetical protein ACGF12_35865 [Kitasatospora sp. NPDC048296]|uniref:hypothetical protein n=1 Tax=Kitasatospora sp. NPDC048296 TaxID=3364048 RepID=UPI003720387D